MMKKIAAALFILLFSSQISAAEAMFVQSREAKLLDSPNFKGTVLRVLAKGEEVTVLETQQRWVKVLHGRQQGWVSRFLLSNQPPLAKVDATAKGSEAIERENIRRRASAVTTAGAARGLANEDRLRSSDAISINNRTIEMMEQTSIPVEQVRAFLQEGLIQ